MIHQYKAKGFNIVLDIYSGSVHLVDDVTYDIIEKYENTDKDLLKTDIKEKYANILLERKRLAYI